MTETTALVVKRKRSTAEIIFSALAIVSLIGAFLGPCVVFVAELFQWLNHGKWPDWTTQSLIFNMPNGSIARARWQGVQKILDWYSQSSPIFGVFVLCLISAAISQLIGLEYRSEAQK